MKVLNKKKCPRKIYYLWIPTSNVRGRKRLQILWTSFMYGPHTLRGWNELLDYLQTNNALGKSKFINYNFHDSTLLPPLSTIQQDVLDYLNEFIALQSVRDEYYKELTKPILLSEFSGEYLKIHGRGSGHRAILLVFIYNIVITIVSLYYKKSSPLDTIEMSIKCLPFFCVKNCL